MFPFFLFFSKLYRIGQRSVGCSARQARISSAASRRALVDPTLRPPRAWLGFCLPLHSAAPILRTYSKIEELLNLMQREAQCLSVSDEPKPPFLIFAIDPVSRRSARRRSKQPEPFVVLHCLDVDANRFRELPGGAPNCHFLTSDETLHPAQGVPRQESMQSFLLTHLSVRILLNNRLLSIASMSQRRVYRHCTPAYRSLMPLAVFSYRRIHPSIRTRLTLNRRG